MSMQYTKRSKNSEREGENNERWIKQGKCVPMTHFYKKKKVGKITMSIIMYAIF